MRMQEIDKIVVVSAAPVGPRDEQPLFERRVAMPILDHLFGNTYQDMRRMETSLHDSEIDWVCMRPPRLVGKPATGAYRLDANRPLPNARSLTFSDLASALLDSLDLPYLYRRSPFVAN
jgi:putative NADH-flavin reductase